MEDGGRERGVVTCDHLGRMGQTLASHYGALFLHTDYGTTPPTHYLEDNRAGEVVQLLPAPLGEHWWLTEFAPHDRVYSYLESNSESHHEIVLGGRVVGV